MTSHTTRKQTIFPAALATVIYKSFFLFALLALTGASVMRAQTSGTGSIEGTVTDATGALVSGATVTATNTLTGADTVSTTTGTGHFVLSLLQPGPYSVTVKAPGFQTIKQEHVIVEALADVQLSPKLAVGETTVSVEVTDQPTMLMTQDVKLGSSINNDTYDSLPLAMNQSARDPSAFIGLAVGVNSFSVQAAGPSTASFNGGQTYQNETYIEGLPMTSAGTESDTRNLAFGISVEAVEQFQVATTGSEAMYEGQGVTNFIVKSGSSKFHGGVYEFFRNTVFDTRGFFPTSVPIEHQNEFGGSISGPILKNKLFFFANYDGYRFDSAIVPSLQNIPTTAERNGDFSAFPNPIYDPTTCTATNASGACIARAQFSYKGVLNVIDPARISKVAQSFQSYLPAVTNGAITQNYLASLPNLVNNDSGTLKVDWDLSTKHRIYGVFSRGKYANPVTGSLAAATATTNSTLPIPYTDGRGVIEYATLAQIHDAYVFRPSLVNDFGYGFSRLFIPLTSNTASGNYPTKAGLTGLPPGVAATGFPDVTFTGNNIPVSWDGTNSHANIEAQSTYTAQDNVLWTKGRHQFTFGFQVQWLQDNDNNPLTGTQAGFTFGPNETANFTSTGVINTATGLAYASYLLGAVDSSVVTQNAVIETGGRYQTYAPYVQDNIQVTPNLTINLGLRWDIWTPFKEVQNRMSFFNPNIPNPVAGNILGALQFAGSGPDSCGCATPVQTHYKNFGPRVGLAYKLGEKTVLRAAYGMFYAHAGGVGGRTNGRQGLSQIGFNNNGSLGSTVTGQPAYYWDKGYPGNPINPPFFNPSYGIGFITATAPGAAAIGSGPGTAQGLVYGDPAKGGQAPQYQDFFLNIQRAIGSNMTLSIAYSGSVGRYLPGAGVASPFTNQIPLKYLPLGSLLTQTLSASTIASAAALGFTVAVPFPNFTGNVNQALRPYPQYAGLSNPWLDVGKSSYNSLQATFNRRMSAGLTFMINYTFSKEMDDLAGNRLPGANYLEYSVGALDRKHVLTSTAVYQLPFGAGRKYNSDNLFVRSLISGWQLSGIFTAATGAPLSVGGTCTGGGIIDASCYPNYTPGFSGSARIGSKPSTVVAASTPHLNKAAFTNPAVFTYGNAARTAPYGLFAPTITDIDASVRRDIQIHESLRFSIQGDVFNLPNTVYFTAPNTTLDSANYGFYAGQANQARKWQLSARLTF
jgi:Carboxypeptidase regulatory-like domain/TonB dependent receptor